jgi:hypothetical protein
LKTDSGRRFHEVKTEKTVNAHRVPEWNTGKEIESKITEILRKASAKITG